MFSFRTALADILYVMLGEKKKKIVSSDTEYYCSFNVEITNKSDVVKINYALLHFPAYRSIFYYRLRSEQGMVRYMTVILKWILPEMKTIEIYGEIGRKLIIAHNSAVINVHKAGDCLTVLPYAVIGKGGNKYKRGSAPTIGNRVFVGAGAIVIGDIKVGNDVYIGAGSVVNTDVPSDCVVVGNPARIIKLRGKKCDIPLGQYTEYSK